MFHTDVLQHRKTTVSDHYISSEAFMHSLIFPRLKKRQYYK